MTMSAPALGALAVDPTDVVALWAEARLRYLAEDFPPYGSPAWYALHPDDPVRFASVIDAAEKWRKYGDEAELLQWFREASQRPEAIHRRRTLAELDEKARQCRVQALDAWTARRAAITPNPRWPQAAIPGQENRT
ncbi:DUF2742 domain-containing protein [Streptomyces sp. G3]|uniref:DUF2742 domain-containing protein n=1 Tax=Streptomyces sp. G3 TaxID=690144 RepID=UPI00202E5CCF|nr:DUF2742 domain-containing protein [Streptomyces sp. G3]MCM1939489.1 DUF2742 domain-containing protein [Streptomyces sp. G3]